MLALGKKHEDKVYFSYTGSIPAAPAPHAFTTISISRQANMDLWDKATDKSFAWMNTKRAGNDMRGLPVGNQQFNKIKFAVIDPTKNERKAVLALSVMKGFPRQVNIPVNDKAGAVYLLHASSDNVPSNVAGAITFLYADGSEASQYLMKDKEVTNWWFSNLHTERSGVAWSGPNPVCSKVGVCWAVIDNPFPEKEISALQFHAPLEGGIYSLLGITLADKPFYIQPKGPSYGGPDNWAAANGMAALVEGLAGVKNVGLAFDTAYITPRWSTVQTDAAKVVITFAASNKYVAYQYRHKKGKGNQLAHYR